MNRPFRPCLVMHINYLEQGQSLDYLCRRAVEWGFDGVEFRHKTATSGDPEPYLDRIASAVAQSGLRLVSFGMPGPDLMLADPNQRDREIYDYEHFLTLVAERFTLTALNTAVGALLHPDPKVNPEDYTLQGSAISREEHWEQAVEGFRRIAVTCERLDLQLALEIHPGYLHDLPAPTLKLIEMIGSNRIGANLDYGNVVYFPGHPSLEDSVGMLSKHLLLVHLKNSVSVGGHRLPVSLSEGEINHRSFLSLLRNHEYHGSLCIEAPRSGDRESFAKPDLDYLKTLLSDLNN